MRVDEAIIQLIGSEDPRKLGYRKIGKWKGVYSYEIGRKIRILYRVRFKDRTIIFLDVGTHKIY
ncbi:MAG: type II toxin-antitoxin system mRNA interferase toxin, RelE/StbE family [Nitrososphaerales archaeon]